jgi:allophanate hydrolase subunit 1
MLILIVAEQVVPQLSVATTVYTVFTVGVAIGFTILGLLKPVVGDHEYV